jgi:hypothetical protein
MKRSRKKKCVKKNKKLSFGLSVPRSKKGQMGTGLMTGLFVAVFVFIMLSAFLPVIIEMIGTSKGSNSANCVGYVDPNAASLGVNNKSYNPALSSDTITCSILNFTPGMLVLSIVFAIVSGIIAGRLSMGSPEPQQQYYPQY